MVTYFGVESALLAKIAVKRLAPAACERDLSRAQTRPNIK